MLKYVTVLWCRHEVCELKKTFCRNVLSKNVYSTMITLYLNKYIYIYIYIFGPIFPQSGCFYAIWSRVLKGIKSSYVLPGYRDVSGQIV